MGQQEFLLIAMITLLYVAACIALAGYLNRR